MCRRRCQQTGRKQRYDKTTDYYPLHRHFLSLFTKDTGSVASFQIRGKSKMLQNSAYMTGFRRQRAPYRCPPATISHNRPRISRPSRRCGMPPSPPSPTSHANSTGSNSISNAHTPNGADIIFKFAINIETMRQTGRVKPNGWLSGSRVSWYSV